MLYRQFNWANTKTIPHICITCIRPHLEYACQLWDPYTNKDSQLLEDVQKFACKVCLKQWNLDYHSMLCLLGLPPLTIRHKYLKLVTMYNIISGNMYFPSGHFVYYTSPYPTRNCNFIRPFSRLNYMYHSFVPSVISLWNNLPQSVKLSSSVYCFKELLQYHLFTLRPMFILASCYFMWLV